MLKYVEFIFSGLMFALFAQVRRNQPKLTVIAAKPVSPYGSIMALSALDVAYNAKSAITKILQINGQK
jgi:hypothetical protein